MITRDLSTPIWQLTVGEFLDLLEKQNTLSEQPVHSYNFTQDEYVHGIGGIAKLFGCNRCTAQKIKNSGVIDDALTQNGRLIVVHARHALELVRKSKAK